LVAGGLEGSVKFEFHKILYLNSSEQPFYYSTIGSKLIVTFATLAPHCDEYSSGEHPVPERRKELPVNS